MIPFAASVSQNVAALEGPGTPPPTFAAPFLVAANDGSAQTAGTTQSFTTTANIPAGSGIVILATPASANLSSVSGGGVTWGSAITFSTYFPAFGCVGIAPVGGIASGTTITLTLSASDVTQYQVVAFPGCNGTITTGSFSDSAHVASGFSNSAGLTPNTGVTGPIWQMLQVCAYQTGNAGVTGNGWTYLAGSDTGVSIAPRGYPNAVQGIWLRDSGTGTSTCTTSDVPALTLSTNQNWNLIDIYVGSN